MGKKGKGRKATNKNKGKRGGGGGPRGVQSPSSDPSTLIKGTVPDFDDVAPSTVRNYTTIYARYKAATRRFLNYMKANVPDDIVGDGSSGINFLLPAAEYLRDRRKSIDPRVLRDLRLCIRMRRKVADSVFGGGDAGHKYFLQVLVFCWTALRLLPTTEEAAYIEEEQEEEVAEERTANPFSALYDEEEDVVMDEDVEMFPATVPRPEPEENPLTVEDLISGDDRNDAIFFLLTLDELMGLVAGQYSVLVRNWHNHNRQGVTPSAIIENLMDGTICANYAIQAVQQLEAELVAQHPHLTTPCRLLATLALPEVTANVAAIVKDHGAKTCGREDVIAFVGDSVQCVFHNLSDSWNRKDTIVDEFVGEYELDAVGKSELEQLFKGISLLTVMEIPMKPDGADIERTRSDVSRQAGRPHPSHSWLANMNYISGDRAIHHTIRILQLFGGVIDNCPSDKNLTADPRRRGMFGNPLWAPGRSARIRDMDELVFARLLPNWANMCRHGIVGKVVLPRERELCPFFVQLKNYVNHPREPVTWSLAFGVHAALTSIVEVGRALPDLVEISKIVFTNYFDQTTNAMRLSLNEKSSQLSRAAVWKHNLCTISFLQNFGLPVYDDLAIWNPLCGGTSITTMNYLGNIEGGCAIIDCQAQLRIVMYLYHGLIVNRIFGEAQIPLMKNLYDGFKRCKALWSGSGPPKRGDLVKQWWISFGMNPSDARQMSENARILARGGRSPSEGLFAQGVNLSRGRQMRHIEPAEILTSFRRICERDFHDVVDKYHTPEQKKNTRGMEQYHVAVRTNDTLDHLEDEITLHALNFAPTAAYLEQFVCSVTRVLGWETLLKAFKRENNLDMRQGFAIIFAQHVLGALDFAADPLNHEFRNVPGLVALSPASNIIAGMCQFFEEFFERTPPSNILWFQAMDAGDGTNVEVVR